MDANEYLKDGLIDISGDGLVYWSKKLRCSEKDLREAVYKLGNGYTVITLYLEMNQMIREQDE
ncbi:MAG: DUF3606 domain-containing protein [Bacteroidetes bacterium]|nr:DUF3606 domain-containing protein [Bacteroidota bacterium]